MLGPQYKILEQYYLLPKDVAFYEDQKHLFDFNDILITNPNCFSLLSPKSYYYFRMPHCGHPLKISPYSLYKKILDGKSKEMCCNICKLFLRKNITYDHLALLYSINNGQPLSNITLRGTPLLFTCPQCHEDTLFKELRWVLIGLKEGKSYTQFCKKKCNTIGVKFPELVMLWDNEKNNIDIFSVPADDDNLHHRKRYFRCIVCMVPITTPTTVNNVIKNSSKCSIHKINKTTSFAEQAIFLSFKRCLEKFPMLKVTNKYKYEGNKEFDIYIEFTTLINDKYGVEVDGSLHKERIKEDQVKNKYAKSNNIHLVRVRDLELKDITFKDFKNVIQRQSKNKEELNDIIHVLLKDFLQWLSKQEIAGKLFGDIQKSLFDEIKRVSIFKDEKEIFINASQSINNLLKDDLSLSVIFDQLRADVKENLGDFITITEQDIKRPFICKECGHGWDQYVNVVVKNFQNSSSKEAKGCPKCSNKDKKANNELINKAFEYRKQGLTQKEISKKLDRSQSTISNWLSYKSILEENNVI